MHMNYDSCLRRTCARGWVTEYARGLVCRPQDSSLRASEHPNLLADVAEPDPQWTAARTMYAPFILLSGNAP
eukprot:9094267-Pyramimonas_sp.AAC.3